VYKPFRSAQLGSEQSSVISQVNELSRQDNRSERTSLP